MPLTAGTRLGSYDIQSPLGAGGMGEVYRARDLKLDREVAIKVLPEEWGRDPHHVARFRREARAASSLNHPNICTIHELNEHDGRAYLVMELLRGETLRERLARGPMPASDILILGAQLADALAAAHAEGVIHRDIKPENIFITDRGPAKILDFGLARKPADLAGDGPTGVVATAVLTGPGLTLGTLAYMSPEQALGESVDARTDLFSLGLVLYEMATGAPAFGGTTVALIIDGILHRAPAPVVQVRRDVPLALDTVIGRLLEKDRSRRHPSAVALLADLEAIARRDSSAAIGTAAVAAEAVKTSVVVLPFQNVSADKDNEYFADGLTDEIIADLSQVGTLRVISRSSSMQLKGSAKDVRTIARELDVRYALDGSVRKAASSVRVTAQLIDATRDEQLWAEKYTGTLDDIFDIQEKISRSIVQALRVKLSPREEQKIAERPIENVHAYECYHRARHEIYRFTRDGLGRASSLIQSGLSVVGDNELLHASLGIVYWQYVNGALTADEGYLDRAEACARRVFELNAHSAVGHELLGVVHYARGHRQDAVRSLRRALDADPNCWYALAELQRIYNATGQAAHSAALLDRMLASDPLSMITHVAALFTYTALGQYTRHRETAWRFLEAAPEWSMLRAIFVLSLIYEGRLDEARAVLEAAPAEKIPTISGQTCTFLRHAFAGRRDDALASFTDEVTRAARRVEWWCWHVADCYAFVDEYDAALEWLEAAVDRGLIHYPLLSQHDRILRRLDRQPRFQTLLERVKVAWQAFEPCPSAAVQ